MNIDNLRMFCRVIEEGSISSAARLGYVSQPAVTKQIRQIERQYDTLLFERIGQKLIPTEAGKKLYPFAREIIAYYEQSEEAIKEYNGNCDVTLNIGASFTIGDYLLPGLMGTFKKKFPDYMFNLSIGNTPNIVSQLENKTIDIALVESPVDNHVFIIEPFAKDELVLITPGNHHWKNRKEIASHELAEEKMILREAESGTRLILEKVLKEIGMLEKIDVSMELGSFQSIKSSVEAELGISILPRLTVEQELKFGTLNKVKITDLSVKRDLWMVRRPQRFNKMVLKNFVDFIRGS